MDENKIATVGDMISSDTSKALDNVSETASEYGRKFVERAKDYAQQTDRVVHDWSWTAIAIAMGIGFVAGLLVNRR